MMSRFEAYKFTINFEEMQTLTFLVILTSSKGQEYTTRMQLFNEVNAKRTNNLQTARTPCARHEFTTG